MSKRLALLVVILVMATAFAALAQTDFTIQTYIATSTSASETTVRTKRANYEGFGTGSMTQNTYVATSSAASQAVSAYGATEEAIARRITEATSLSTSAAAPFVLFEYWDPSTLAMTYMYKDATGTIHTWPGASATAALADHELDQSTHGATVVASEARVAAHELDQSTHGCTVVASEARITAVGGGLIQGATQVASLGANVFTDQQTIPFALFAPQVATPSAATGVMFLDASDGALKISLDGSTWTTIAP
jgi:hypothetical protein